MEKKKDDLLNDLAIWKEKQKEAYSDFIYWSIQNIIDRIENELKDLEK